MYSRTLPIAALVLVCTLPAISTGGSLTGIDSLVVFGDSLSDVGNATIATNGQFPGPGYAPGRFSNGPLWVDQFSSRAGLGPVAPALAGGNDYAVASAATGSSTLQDISNQVGAYLLSHPNGADSTALYAVWGGANDLFNATSNGTTAADNLANNIRTLAAAGGAHFIWFNLPPLGQTPRAGLMNSVDALTASTLDFNNAWRSDIDALHAQGIDVTGINVFNLFGDIGANPGAFGLSNLTAPAQTTPGADPSTYLFWDIQHPTTAGHGFVSDLVINDLTTPEPASLVLLAFGASTIFFSRRRVR